LLFLKNDEKVSQMDFSSSTYFLSPEQEIFAKYANICKNKKGKKENQRLKKRKKKRRRQK